MITSLYYRYIRYINRHKTVTPEFIRWAKRDEFIEWAKKYLDYPYVLGGDGSSQEAGIDCSHLVCRSLTDAGSMNRYFYRTAKYLRNLTQEIMNPEDIRKGDLLFLWDDSGEIGHVAIILEWRANHVFLVLDVSWPSTGIWSTIIREVDVSGEKHFIGSPLFLA